MSSKRQATTDLNHDNWDREEEPENRGTFATASEDELKNRIIKKAKRKLSPGGEAATDVGTASKSVFSGFSGFGKPAANIATTSASPFSFLSKITSASSSNAASTETTTSTSGIVSSSTTTTKATPTFSFGNSTVTSSVVAKTTEAAKPTSTFSFGSNNSLTKSTDEAKTGSSTSKDTSSEYFTKLSTLNKAVSEWIKTHVDKNPLCILTPIFKDYETYLKELEDERKKDEAKESKAADKDTVDKAAQSSLNAATFKFSTTIADTKTNTVPTSTTVEMVPKTNGFSFGFKKTEETNSSTATTSTFSFGLKTTNSETSLTTTATSTTTPSTGFFASSAAKPFSFTPGATPFSFGNIQPPAPTASTTSEAAGDNDDENDEPPKNEFKQVVEEDAVYSKKCKVFVKKDGNFVDKGVGTLYLKPVESSDKTQLLVRADTNLGNILVNLILSSAIPAQRMGKNNVMMICLPTPDAEKPTSMLLRVKTSEEADDLLANIDKYKK